MGERQDPRAHSRAMPTTVERASATTAGLPVEKAFGEVLERRNKKK
jgi:hypothetical protein